MVFTKGFIFKAVVYVTYNVMMQIHIPKPPKGRQKAALRACVRKMQPADGGHVLRGPVAHPVNPAPNSQLLDYTGWSNSFVLMDSYTLIAN